MAKKYFNHYNISNKECFNNIGEWLDLDGFKLIENGILNKPWDPYSEISITRDISINGNLFLKSTYLEENDILRIRHCWLSSGASLKGASDEYYDFTIGQYEEKDSIYFKIPLLIPGYKISNDLILKTIISLVNKKSHSNSSALITGSILWQDETKVLTEGASPMFPSDIVSFGEKYENANWFLEIGNLESTISAGMKLKINSNKKKYFEAISNNEHIKQQLYMDLARQIIVHCIQDDDFKKINQLDQFNKYETGTIGECALNIISSKMKDSTPSKLYNLYINEPLEFEREIQHFFSKSENKFYE